MPDGSKELVCKECKQNIEKTIKMLVFGGTAIAVGYALYKGKTGGIPTELISDVTKDVVLGSTKNAKQIFGGLSQSLLDSIAKGTSRGVKAIVEGDTLVYFYESASGKTIKSARYIFDEAGKLVGYLGNGSNYYSNSPRFFREKVLEKMLEIK